MLDGSLVQQQVILRISNLCAILVNASGAAQRAHPHTSGTRPLRPVWIYVPYTETDPFLQPTDRVCVCVRVYARVYVRLRVCVTSFRNPLTVASQSSFLPLILAS